MDLSRLRVWRNLVSCDCNLMLSSGLPMTVDPLPIADAGSRLLGHSELQEPGDTRITALVELVAIIHRRLQKAGLRSPRHLDERQLSHLNLEMETWSNHWATRLQNTQYQHHCIPFTSWRWYRLAMNTAPLGKLFSQTEQCHVLQLHLLQSLDISVKTSAHILLALSDCGQALFAKYRTSGATEIPPGPFHIDRHATDQLKYAVDLTWISLTFATVFLILCYVRGVIDGEFTRGCRYVSAR